MARIVRWMRGRIASRDQLNGHLVFVWQGFDACNFVSSSILTASGSYVDSCEILQLL